MPLKLKVEELIEAFSDSRVAQAIASAIMPYIRDSLPGIVREEMVKLTTQLNEVCDEQSSHRRKIDDLETQNALLHKQIADIDADRRLSSLIIRGLPVMSLAERTSATSESASGTHASAFINQPIPLEVTERSIIELCKNDLKLDLRSSDIEIAYRMKGPSTGASSESTQPVFVRFVSRKVRNAVFDQRRLLVHRKDSKIFLCENLSKAASSLFYEARKMQRDKRIFGCWTASGNIFVKRTEMAKPVLVRDMTSLNLSSRA